MSCKRVLYNEFSNKHKLKVVDYLNKSYGWEPVFMAGHQPTQEVTEWKSKNNYSCIIKDSMDLRKGQFDYDQIGRPRPIDADIVNVSGKCDGQVSAEVVSIQSSGKISGDIFYENISIEEGAIVEAQISKRKNKN